MGFRFRKSIKFKSNKNLIKRLIDTLIILLLLATALFLFLMLRDKDLIQAVHFRNIASVLTLIAVTLILTKDYFIKNI